MDLETAGGDEWHANSQPRIHRIPGWNTHSKRGKLERCLFVHESNETRVVSHVDDPLICAKPATLEKIWPQITKFVVIKRGEALNSRILVTYIWDSSTELYTMATAEDSQ